MLKFSDQFSIAMKKKWAGCSASVSNIMNMFLDFMQEYKKMEVPVEEMKIAPVNKKRPVSKTAIQKLKKIAEDFGKVTSKKSVKKVEPKKPVKKVEPKKPVKKVEVKKAVPVKKFISALKKKNK